jgi:hypothetical protein
MSEIESKNEKPKAFDINDQNELDYEEDEEHNNNAHKVISRAMMN